MEEDTAGEKRARRPPKPTCILGAGRSASLSRLFSLGEGVRWARPRHQLQNQKDTSPAPARSGSRKASVTLTPRLHCPLAAPRTRVPRGPAILEPALKELTLEGPPPPGPPYKTPVTRASAATAGARSQHSLWPRTSGQH